MSFKLFRISLYFGAAELVSPVWLSADKSFTVPPVFRAVADQHPARPVPRRRVRILSRNETRGRRFANRRVIALVELAALNHATGAVELARSYALACQHPFGSWNNLVVNEASSFVVTFEQ